MSTPQRKAQSVLTIDHPNGNRINCAVSSANIVNTTPSGIRVPDDVTSLTVKDILPDAVAIEISALHNAASNPANGAFKFSAQLSVFNNAGGSKTWLLTGCWVSRVSAEQRAVPGMLTVEFKIVADRVYPGECLTPRPEVDSPDAPDEENEKEQSIDQTIISKIPEIVGRPVNPEDLEEQGEA